MAKEKLFIPRSAIIAILVHVVVFSLFIFGFQMPSKPSQARVDPVNIVKAEVIDGAAIEQEKQRIKAEAEARERKRREQELRKQREAEEKKRQQEEAKRQQEEQRQAEIKQAKEEKRLAEEKAAKEAEARKQAELEKQQAEQAKKAAEEKAEQERIRAEENAKKLAEELKKQQEAKRKAEQLAEQKRLEAILEQEEAEMRAEQERQAKAARQRELNTLLSQYQNAIQSKIGSRWRKPPGIDTSNAFCKVYVKQAVGGYIQEVVIKQCSGGGEQFKKSVEEAVWKSDPLPAPPDEELFARELLIKFKPSQ